MIQSASISLRSDMGVHFGTAYRIEQAKLIVETDGIYRLGAELEFQLELPRFGSTVYGSVRVQRAAVRSDDLNRYQLDICKLRAEDAVLLQEWVEDMKSGGTSANPQRHVTISNISLASDMQVRQLGGGTTWDGGRMAARREGRGRMGIRAMLRSRLGSEGAPQADPELSFDTEASMPRLQLLYRSWRAYYGDFEGGLERGALLVELSEDRPALGTTLELLFELPSGVEISCLGTVEALTLTGFGVAIEGDPAQLFSQEGEDPASLFTEEGEEIDIVLMDEREE